MNVGVEEHRYFVIGLINKTGQHTMSCTGQ